MKFTVSEFKLPFFAACGCGYFSVEVQLDGYVEKREVCQVHATREGGESEARNRANILCQLFSKTMDIPGNVHEVFEVHFS